MLRDCNILGTIGIGASVGEEPLFSSELAIKNTYTVKAQTDSYLLETNTVKTADGVVSKIKQSLEEKGLV